MARTRIGRRVAAALVLCALVGGGLFWRYRNGPFPPWTARQAAAALSELEVPRGRTIRFAPQWSVGNPDATLDVTLEFEHAQFVELEKAARTANYQNLTPDDPNSPLVQSVAENADSALYRLWRVGDGGSWRMAVLDLERRRIYASKVMVSY